MPKARKKPTTAGAGLLQLHPRVRLKGMDERNWELEVKAPVTNPRTGTTTMKWKSRGYFSQTAAGLQAAVRVGAETDLRLNGGELDASAYTAAHDTFVRRLEAIAARLMPELTMQNAPVTWQMISEDVRQGIRRDCAEKGIEKVDRVFGVLSDHGFRVVREPAPTQDEDIV